MTTKPLLVLDFDGVIVDGISEYWWSSRQACIQLTNGRFDSTSLPLVAPSDFRFMRPWVHFGWEMVLIAAELLRPGSTLCRKGSKVFADNYEAVCQEALTAWGWEAQQLQETLESVRWKAINSERDTWLKKYQPFPKVIKRLNSLAKEEIDFAILTTKGTKFTLHLLEYLQLNPSKIYGHESGSKINVLLELSKTRLLLGFIEDRRITLEKIAKIKDLNSLPCYLASWGYLKPNDKINLPKEIRLLRPEEIAAPLASWP